ncbi:hypothetical protein ABTI33_09875 [Acinetobacter baumannii]
MRKIVHTISIATFISLAVGCHTIPRTDWPETHKKTALESYIYAQMANNTYGQKGDGYNSNKLDFVLPSDWSFTHFGNDDKGFAYSIYKKTNNNRLQEVVIAYRGTEGFTNFKDFIYGNLGTKQRKLAAAVYQKERNKLNAEGFSDVPIILTGHSLGGALAIDTAINLEEDVPYYVFNTSPRFNKLNWSEIDEKKDIRKRNSIVETGEFLSFLRYPAREPYQIYTPYNCDKYYRIISSHGIEKLTRCLIEVAKLSDPTIQIETVSKGNRD